MSVYVRWIATIAMFAAAHASNGNLDRVIATTGTGPIPYRLIACEEALRSKDDCHEIEQRRLARRLRSVWLQAAAKANNISLSADEKRDVDQRVAAAEPFINKSAARFHALALAAVRVRKGEDRTAVERDVATEGITGKDLDWELEHLPTLADAERAASRDFVAEARKSMTNDLLRAYTMKRLHDTVRQRAVAEGVSFEIAEEEFWSDVIRNTQTRIVDPTFELPDRKGILVNP